MAVVDLRYEDALALVAEASRPYAAPPHRVPDPLTGDAGWERLVDRAVLDALQDAVARTWSAGWQPVDLVRAARRRVGEPTAAAMADAIAARMRAFPAATVDPRWAAQLTALGTTVWWGTDAAWISRWQSRYGYDRTDTLVEALRALYVLRTLPPVPVLVPPPGTARPGTDPRTRHTERVDARKLDRIRALLAKAESTTFPEEAESYTAKAQELMARHSIDAALVEAQRPQGAAPTGVRIGIDSPYGSAKALLLSAVAGANRCRAVYTKTLEFCTVFGFPTDLELVELLYTSLLVQATSAVSAEGRRRDLDGRSRTRSFRQSFLTAYAYRIGERLDGATARAEATAQDGSAAGALLPVLAARKEAVDETLESAFPQTSRLRTTLTNHAGWESGRAAADRASLQPRRPLA